MYIYFLFIVRTQACNLKQTPPTRMVTYMSGSAEYNI